MPKSQARTAFGSKFFCAASAADVSQAANQWGEVISLKPPSDTADTTEVTHFESPGRFREWIKTLIDSGEADIVTNLVPGSVTHLAMQAGVNNPDAMVYVFLIPNATGFWKIQGDCLVTGFDPETPLEDRMTATSRIKFTGARTEAQAAAQ